MPCLSGTLLLLWLCCLHHDVEASSCDRTIHKNIGETVELSSCSPTEGVTTATWKYNDKIVADKDVDIKLDQQFRGRLKLNNQTFNLAVNSLTLEDSGVYIFTSVINDRQTPTVYITLQVHERITEEPILTANSAWHASTQSCTVVLDCRATFPRKVSFTWTVKNQTHEGSRLLYLFRPEDGNIGFTCKIFNYISEKSATKQLVCRNDSSPPPIETGSFTLIICVATGSCLVIVIAVGIAVAIYYSKERQADRSSNRLAEINQDETQQQIYSSLLHGDGCVYESLNLPENAGNDK